MIEWLTTHVVLLTSLAAIATIIGLFLSIANRNKNAKITVKAKNKSIAAGRDVTGDVTISAKKDDE